MTSVADEPPATCSRATRRIAINIAKLRELKREGI